MSTKAATELFKRFLLFARKKLAKTNKEGIMKIPNDEQAKALANETIAKFTTYKVPPSSLNTADDIAMIDNQINNIEQNKLVNEIKKNLTPKKDNVIDITDKMPNPFENLEAAKKAGNFKGIANQVLRDPDIAREFMLSKKFPTTVASGEDAIPIARRAKFDEEIPYKPLPDEEYTVEKIVKDFKKVGATDKDIQTILTSGQAGQIPYVMSNYGLSFKDVLNTIKRGDNLIEGIGKEISPKTLKEELMKTDNPFSELVKTTEKGPKTIAERRAEAEALLKKEKAISESENVVPLKPKDFASGGRAEYFTGGLINLIKAASKVSPLQAYKNYIKSVKTRAQKGDVKSLAPELGAVAGGGIFVNRRMSDILENMKNQDMENNLENFKKELNEDPFYKKYPDIKDKVLENYIETMFGEKKADGGRAGFKSGSYLFEGAKKLGRKYKGSTLEAILENPKLLGTELGYEGLAEILRLFGFKEGGRIGYKDGPDQPSRRKFLKIAGGLAALPIIGKFFKPAKIASKAAPVIKKTISSTPSYFFDLVNKIKILGDEGKSISPRTKTTVYKNYELEEDLTTGDIVIVKQKGDPDFAYEEEVLSFRKGQADETTKGKTPPDEYEEFTVRPDGDGKMKDVEDGIEPEGIKEIMEELDVGGGNLDDLTLNEIKRGKLASGGIARMLGE